MISKKEFIATLNFIKKHKTMERDLAEVFQRMDPHDLICTSIYCDYEDLVVKLLRKLFNLPDTCDLIEYFMYELDFGNDERMVTANLESGIDLRNAGQLYDLLVEEAKKNGKTN